jgi:hypothetical protein
VYTDENNANSNHEPGIFTFTLTLEWQIYCNQKLIGSTVLRILNAKFLYDFYLSIVDLLPCEEKNILWRYCTES